MYCALIKGSGLDLCGTFRSNLTLLRRKGLIQLILVCSPEPSAMPSPKARSAALVEIEAPGLILLCLLFLTLEKWQAQTCLYLGWKEPLPRLSQLFILLGRRWH